MAKEQALQFIAYVNNNQGAQDKLQSTSNNDLDALVKIAKDAGYDFTMEELQAAAIEQLEIGAQVLPDDAVESIVGGTNNPAAPGHNGYFQHKHIGGVKFE